MCYIDVFSVIVVAYCLEVGFCFHIHNHMAYACISLFYNEIGFISCITTSHTFSTEKQTGQVMFIYSLCMILI